MSEQGGEQECEVPGPLRARGAAAASLVASPESGGYGVPGGGAVQQSGSPGQGLQRLPAGHTALRAAGPAAAAPKPGCACCPGRRWARPVRGLSDAVGFLTRLRPTQVSSRSPCKTASLFQAD